MSLVGTRPPTLDEWEKYELHHRARLGINQGDSIYTEDNSSKRMLMPEEIGEYARLLVSDAGDMLAGETIHISSGRGIWDIR